MKQKTSPYNFCKAIVWSHFNTVFSSDNPVLLHPNNIEKVKPQIKMQRKVGNGNPVYRYRM